jgi:hypothetical protein
MGGAGEAGEGGASTEELNAKITTLEKEKNKEEEYRNYMQLERVRPPPIPSSGFRV